MLEFAATPLGVHLRFGIQRTLVTAYRTSELAHIHTAQGATQIIVIDWLPHAGEVHAQGDRLTAPMPGKVWTETCL